MCPQSADSLWSAENTQVAAHSQKRALADTNPPKNRLLRVKLFSGEGKDITDGRKPVKDLSTERAFRDYKTNKRSISGA
jgi:hypothetical protein